MTFNDKLIEQLRRHEGVRTKPYRCSAGKLTIGVGRNLEDRGLSQDEIDYLLQNDINIVAHQAMSLPFWDQLSENRKLVIVDMIFNMGFKTFLTFKNTLRFIEAGNYAKAADNMLLSKWAKQVGKRAKFLSDMMRKG